MRASLIAVGGVAVIACGGQDADGLGTDGASADTSTAADAARADGEPSADAAPTLDGDMSPDASTGPGELVCNDLLDDDGNGTTDCDDPACDGACAVLEPPNFQLMYCEAPKRLVRLPIAGLPAPLRDAQELATTTSFTVTMAEHGRVVGAALLLSFTHQRIGDPRLEVLVPGQALQRIFQDLPPYQGPIVVDEALLGPFSWDTFNGRPWFTESESPFSGAYASAFMGYTADAAGEWRLDFTDDTLGMTGTLTRAEFILCVEPPAE